MVLRNKRRHFLRNGLWITGAAIGFPALVRADIVAQGPIMRTISTAGTPVDSWAARVVANGGAAPAGATVTALQTFWASLVSAAIDTKIIAMIPLVSDNLTAAITPIFGGSAVGNDPWTNNNFVGGDLTADGLLGASTKYLNTGLNPNTIYSGSAASGGLSVYTFTGSNASTIEIGCAVGAANDFFQAYVGFGGTAFFDCWNTNGTNSGRVSGANSNFAGFVTFNRTSATASAIHKANSGTAFTAIVSGTGQASIDTPPNATIYGFATQANGSPGSYTTRRLSFLAVHMGLSAAEAEDLFDAVQALRVALGGGYA